MIIQSSNEPIVLTFSEDASDIPAIRVTLWSGEKLLKTWTKTTVTIDGTTVSCPLTQDETARFPVGPLLLEVKWKDSDGVTEFAEAVQIIVAPRKDRVSM